MFKALFKRHRKDVVELSEVKYVAIVNQVMREFKDKDSMLDFIEKYSQRNTIYSLSMFRYDLFNLIK